MLCLALVGCKEKISYPKKNLIATIAKPLVYESILPDSLIYGFVNSTLLKKNELYRSCDNLYDGNWGEVKMYIDDAFICELGDLLTEEDRWFMAKQFKNDIAFVLKSDLVREKKLIQVPFFKIGDDYRAYLDSCLNKYKCLMSVSVPVFNLNRDLVIVEISISCGILCGAGGYYVYQKNAKGAWVQIRVLEEWGS